MFGDLHGQFTDFLRLLKAFGAPNRMGDIGCVDYLVSWVQGAWAPAGCSPEGQGQGQDLFSS